MDNLAWEDRSRKYGFSINGVLFKNLPKVINEHIHQWHVFCIQHFLHNSSPSLVLDMGCGYGRLTESLKQIFPLTKFVGVDISPNYVELYKKNTGFPAYVHEIEKLPDHLGSFDVILAVTVLMYVPKEELKSSVEKLIKHLTPGGVLIIIEQHCSGRWFQDPFGCKGYITSIFRRAEKEMSTGGSCFEDKVIASLLEDSGTGITERLCLPLTTIFIIPLYFISKIFPSGGKAILAWLLAISKKNFLRSHPTLHAAYLITKNPIK